MKLIELINRNSKPAPWSEGDNIPWNEPGFSERMLAEHLSQEHDLASRKSDRIDKHVYWIHNHVLSATPSRILDLGCGPGLYTTRLAKLGHQCVGIDYSPASIDYARATATSHKLDCLYHLADLREATFGDNFDAVMFIFGELNVFRPADIRLILRKAQQALKPGGTLILEPHTFEAIHEMGSRTPTWHTATSGLFSAKPHIVLEESYWDSDTQTTTHRYFIIDLFSGEVVSHSQSFQAYSQRDYESLLAECGYTMTRFYPSLTGIFDPGQPYLLAILAVKS